MTWVLIAIAGWLTVAAVVGLFSWALGRAAAVGDRDIEEQIKLEHALEAEQRETERRLGAEDRRSAARPWLASAPGRRAEDVLRRDLAEAHRALNDAEDRLQEIEARRSA